MAYITGTDPSPREKARRLHESSAQLVADARAEALWCLEGDAPRGWALCWTPAAGLARVTSLAAWDALAAGRAAHPEATILRPPVTRRTRFQ